MVACLLFTLLTQMFNYEDDSTRKLWDSRPNSTTPTLSGNQSSSPHMEHAEAAMFLNLLAMVDIFLAVSRLFKLGIRDLPRIF